MATLTIGLPGPEELAAVDGVELDRRLWELHQAQRRIEAAIVAAVDRCERTGHFRDDGHRSVATWAMATTNCARREATARQQTARVLRSLPTAASELAAGRLGVDQVRELARLGSNPRCGDQLPGSEEVLLDAATRLEFADFKVVTERWRQLADADGAHQAHEAAHEGRDARQLRVGDELRFETSHGVLEGTAHRAVFDRFCEAEFERDWAWTVEAYGDRATRDLMPRTARQRRADAFTAMLRAAAQTGVGDGRPIDVTVNLVIDQDQFEQQAAAAITGDEVEIDPAGVRDRRCETIDGTAIDPRQVVAAAVVGRIRSIVVDGAGVVVKAGRLRRLFDGALRAAIVAVDPVCGWLGCTLRAQISQIDHLEPAARGGPTDAANGKVMCRHHNLFRQHRSYAARRLGDGTLEIVRPDGTAMRVPDVA